jgi:hypothetical protein
MDSAYLNRIVDGSKKEEKVETTTKLPKAVKKQQDDLNARIAQDERFNASDNGEGAPALDAIVDLAPAHEDWKHKYDVLQGKYNKEIVELRDQIAELQNTIKGMATPAIASPSEPEPQFTPEPIQPFSDEDVDIYGKDMVDFNVRMAESIAEQKLKPVIEKQKRTEEQMFRQNLAMRVPDWENIDTDPDFLVWLNQPVPQANGYTRHAFLMQAYEDRNLDSVSKFFEAFKQQKSQQPPAVPDPVALPGGQPNDPTYVPGDEFEGQVVPPQVPSNGMPEGKPVFKQSDVREFYSQMTTDRRRQKDPRWLERQTQIEAAYAEGRITSG